MTEGEGFGSLCWCSRLDLVSLASNESSQMTVEPETLPLGLPVETSPGVVVERRCFLKTVAVALGAVAIPGLRPSRVGATSAATLSIEEFIDEVVPVARELVKDPSIVGQDRYLMTLASYAVRLADVPRPDFRRSEQGPGAFIGSNGVSELFVVLHWKMEPRAEIRLHAHTYGNVVTLGLEGKARVQNFEVVGRREYQDAQRIRLRQTVDQFLTPGDINLVNLERNYIHGFTTASEGARGLDITTKLREKQPTPYLRLLDDEPGGGNTFDAVITLG